MTAETSLSFDISIRRYDGDQKEDIARNKITIEGEGIRIIEGSLTEDDGDPPSLTLEGTFQGVYIIVDHPVALTTTVKNGEDDVEFDEIPVSRIFLYDGEVNDILVTNPDFATYATIRYKIVVVT